MKSIHSFSLNSVIGLINFKQRDFDLVLFSVPTLMPLFKRFQALISINDFY